MEGLGLLQLAPQADHAQVGVDGDCASEACLQAEALVHWIEAVRQLELVPLGAAEELNPRRTLPRAGLDRGERCEHARREAAERGVEARSVEIDAPLEDKHELERDRAAVDLHGDDSRYVEIG